MLLFRFSYAFYACSPGRPVVVSYLIDSDSGFPFDAGLAGGSPAAAHFSLAIVQRKVSKGKATRSPGPCAARQKRGSAQTRFAQTVCDPDPAFGAHHRPGQNGTIGIGNQRQKPKPHTNKDTPWRVLVDFGIWMLGCSAVRSQPLCLRRGAQLQADQGCALFEPQASLRGPRLKRAPQAARSAAQGRRHQGRLFFGDFLLVKQKKVTRCRATPGQQATATSAKYKTAAERTAGARP